MVKCLWHAHKLGPIHAVMEKSKIVVVRNLATIAANNYVVCKHWTRPPYILVTRVFYPLLEALLDDQPKIYVIELLSSFQYIMKQTNSLIFSDITQNIAEFLCDFCDVLLEKPHEFLDSNLVNNIFAKEALKI